MRRLLALMMCAVSLGTAAQITYPYNPDGNADTLIGVTDMQDLLSTYGQPFFPSEILVEGQTLTSVLMDLQHSIDSLLALSAGGGGSVLDMPIGTILPVASEAVPEGWVLCDGRELAIEDYQGLYDLIGTTYGAGDSAFWAQVFFPATTFNIPDLRGRTIIGADDMGGEAAGIIQHHGGQLGQSGGEELHQLTEEEIPAHDHDFIGTQVGGSSQGVSTNPNNNFGEVRSTSSVGGDQPHNNMQPYMALNYMMKVQSSNDVIDELNQTFDSQIASLENTIYALEERIVQLESTGFATQAWVDSLFSPKIVLEYPNGPENMYLIKVVPNNELDRIYFYSQSGGSYGFRDDN